MTGSQIRVRRSRKLFSLFFNQNTADPVIESSILAPSHTFLEIDHEIISTAILFPSAESFKKGCCQLQVKVVLVNRLIKLAQEKVWLCELTVPP